MSSNPDPIETDAVIASHFVADAAGFIGVKRFAVERPLQPFVWTSGYRALPGDQGDEITASPVDLGLVPAK